MKTAQFELNNHRKVIALKEFFNSEFPNLKLEFYAKPHVNGGTHSDKMVSGKDATIGDCRAFSNDGIVQIESGMTTNELKDYLRDTFGLKVEVYKRSLSTWEIADSGNQSLERFDGLNSYAF